ncbi:MAG TPA: RNA polymerase sigma factor [Xanthomonadales bacterium]|nr:RNA polymerase sigma factor [Xanthomonadales bacterium]
MRESASAGVFRVFNAFSNCEQALKSFLYRFISNRDDIEDICQETLVSALEAERSTEIVEPRAFLFGVARNLMRKQLDRQSRSLIDFVEDFTQAQCDSLEPTVERIVDDRQRMLEFAEMVATLPPQCQRVFIMKKVFGYSHKEIAAELQISVSTVEKHVAAGLKRCLDELESRQQEAAPAVASLRKVAG